MSSALLRTGNRDVSEFLSQTLPPIQFVTALTITDNALSQPTNVDFAWGHFDIDTLRQKIDAESRLKEKNFTLPIYRGRIDCQPDAQHGYGFASRSQMTFLSTSRGLLREPVCEIAMLFDGYDDQGLCRFKLEGKHKGHKAYKGSSGSPIADDEGNIVALVQGGDSKEEVIFGVPLHRYANVIEIST
jgi:hypothetical protein